MIDESKYPTRIAPYGLRMPPELKERVATAAKKNNRPMNAEIVQALEEKYPAPEEFTPEQIVAMVKDLRVLKDMVVEASPVKDEALEKRLRAFEEYYVFHKISKDDMEMVLEENPINYEYKILTDKNK